MNLLKFILIKLRIKKECKNFNIHAYETGGIDGKLIHIGMTNIEEFTEEEKRTLRKGNNVYKTEKEWFINCETDKPYSYSINPMIYSLEDLEK